ncbi:MAG TPA: GDP-mannose 4,6-dehydratase, partial [Polyangiaceae bacterium]|nr:GDP-mannose 4,6-dehydratase [Polyangiaceae bacterium]
ALEPQPRVLVAGSAEVFGDTGGRPISEELPFRPATPYGAGKAAASHLTAAYRASFGLFACVAHFFNHESPRRPERFVTRKIVRAACRIARGLESELTLGDTSVVRDWGWAPEYMEAARRMLLAPEASDFVIATGESHSLAEFVGRVFESVKLEPARYVKRSEALARPGEIPAMRADPSRAVERLGWRATTGFDELAKRLVEAELAALDAESSPA